MSAVSSVSLSLSHMRCCHRTLITELGRRGETGGGGETKGEARRKGEVGGEKESLGEK